MTSEERFENSVTRGQPDDCWLWRGAKSSDGYGQMRVNGRTVYAHRMAWSLAHGMAVPKHQFVCHSCDTPACVNPAHLFVGSHRDNMLDMENKGRHPHRATVSGDAHPCAVLTSQQVSDIRCALASGERQFVVARRYGVRKQVIWRIAAGRTWKST